MDFNRQRGRVKANAYFLRAVCGCIAWFGRLCYLPREPSNRSEKVGVFLLSIAVEDKMGCIYFIRYGEQDIFKIGITSGSVDNRLIQLQTGCPTRLTVYGTINHPYPKIIESELHAALETRRINGEWFRLSMPEINSVLSGNYNLSEIDGNRKDCDKPQWIELFQGSRRYLYNISEKCLYVTLSSIRGMSQMFYACAMCSTGCKIDSDGDVIVKFDFLIEYFPENERELRDQKYLVLGAAQHKAGEL